MVNRYKRLTDSPSQTHKIARVLAEEILKTKPKKAAFLMALEGDLGSGKTTFLQGLAKGLGIRQKVLSPTFVIIRKYKIPRSNPCGMLRGRQNRRYKIQDFYHIDCYRIEKPKEILDLGFKKIISNPKNIVAVEWADRIKKILPKDILTLKFKFITGGVPPDILSTKLTVNELKREIAFKSQND